MGQVTKLLVCVLAMVLLALVVLRQGAGGEPNQAALHQEEQGYAARDPKAGLDQESDLVPAANGSAASQQRVAAEPRERKPEGVAAAGRLRGRVVCADGRPALQACLGLGPKGGRLSLQEDRSRFVEAGADGSFELHVPKAGRYSLVALAPQGGKTVLDDLELDPSDLPQDLEVRLEGSGVLAGQVLDAGLAPVPGMILRFVGADSVPGHVKESFWDWRHLYELKAGGFPYATATTDAQGRFHQAGLVPGDYRVLGRRDAARGPEQDLAGRIVTTGEAELSLRADSARLYLRVQDEQGELVPTSYGILRKHLPGQLPLGVRVQGRRDVHPPGFFDEGAGRWCLHVLRDVSYSIGVFGPDQAFAEVTGTVQEGESQVALVLTLPGTEAKGTVRIEAVVPSLWTEPVEFRAWLTPRVWALDGNRSRLPQDQLLRFFSAEEVESSQPWEVPAGDYILELETKKEREYRWARTASGMSPGDGGRGLQAAPIELLVEAGRATVARPRLRGFGFLRLQVELGGTLGEGQTGAQVVAHAEETGQKTTLWFLGPEDLDAEGKPAIYAGMGRRPNNTLLPGPEQSRLAGNDLVAGPYELHFSLPGYRDKRVPCTIATGQETVVTVSLDPEDS